MKSWWRKLDAIDRQLVSGISMFLVLTILCIGSGLALDVVFDAKKCQRYQTYMPEETFVWNIWTYCLIEAPDGTFVDADDYLGMGRLGLFLDESE
jgi:hypothetical protein